MAAPDPAVAASDPYNAVLVILTEMRTDLKHALARGEDHETRIRSLERSKWALAGFAAAIGTAGGTVASKIIGG